MGVVDFKKVAEGEEILEEASQRVLEEQEEKFKNPEARKTFNLRGKTPQEQRELDELAQGTPEAKG